jgi:EF-P beta-lysylation protein EpmB
MSNQKTLANESIPSADKIDHYSADWQSVLADAIRNTDELCRLVGITADHSAETGLFGVFVPRTFLSRIRPGDPRDPLLLQVMPRPAEAVHRDGFSTDPLGESAGDTPCLLQKYQGRSLILTTAACGVHCRYCFRRHTPREDGSETLPISERLNKAIHQLEDDSSIHEIILSGGDPLTLEDAQIGVLIERLAEIEHVRRLRFHSRMPVVIPQRVTSGLIEVLKSSRMTTSVVIQANHPAELNCQVETALASLIDAGIPVLCQSVLLAGINDRLEVLTELYERLIDCRVMPYYLHQLDHVAGAAHFEVPQERGLELIEGLRKLLPGYAVPRYVREIPGATHKHNLE